MKIRLSLSLLLFFSLLVAVTTSVAQGPTLKEKIEVLSAKFAEKSAPEKRKAYAEGIEAVAKAGIAEKATKKGDAAPDFTLKNATGEDVTLSKELKKGPVVLTWYRGGWCPYCNIQLGAYQTILPEIEAAGATLIAVSPELPDRTLSTKEKNELDFEVLTDTDLKVARKYGLVFKLTPEVAKYYKEAFDLKEYNGKDAADDELPLAATYVIDTDGKIVYSFLDPNYKNRAEPDEILKAIATLKAD